MKIFVSFLIVIFSFTSTFSDPITATVVFENFTQKTSISGVFYISETNQNLQINSLDQFTIILPKKGKYQFRFYSEDVNAITYYPVRITEHKNTVIIKLEDKTTASEVVTSPNRYSIKDISGFSVEQIEEGLINGTINFIAHGLVPVDPDAATVFKTNYGVGFINENCVIDPILFKIAINTNKKIELYLISKFGKDWKNQLPATPFGL